MFDVMEWESLTTDERELQLISDERLIARLRARQLRNLAELDEAQVATADGARSLSEWTAARQEELVLLCWFHHQTVVHQWGYTLYDHPDHGRIRLRPPSARGP